MNPEPLTPAEHEALIDSLVAARQAAPTEANRLLLAAAVAAQTIAAGTKP